MSGTRGIPRGGSSQRNPVDHPLDPFPRRIRHPSAIRGTAPRIHQSSTAYLEIRPLPRFGGERSLSRKAPIEAGCRSERSIPPGPGIARWRVLPRFSVSNGCRDRFPDPGLAPRKGRFIPNPQQFPDCHPNAFFLRSGAEIPSEGMERDGGRTDLEGRWGRNSDLHACRDAQTDVGRRQKDAAIPGNGRIRWVGNDRNLTGESTGQEPGNLCSARRPTVQIRPWELEHGAQSLFSISRSSDEFPGRSRRKTKPRATPGSADRWDRPASDSARHCGDPRGRG